MGLRQYHLRPRMEGYDSNTYGDGIAAHYDELWGRRVDYAAAARCLAGLAGGGPALELGVGTGLFAIELVKLGVEVHGVEISRAMIDRLRSTPEGRKVSVIEASFETLALGRTFPLVFSTFCSFPMSILDGREQAQAMARVAKHVAEGGRLVIEQKAWPWSNQLKVKVMAAGRAVLMLTDYDPLSQQLRGQHVLLGGGQVQLVPYSVRYVSPSELDLMAELGGLKLVDRFGGWRGEPFTAASADHVSVYARV
jgi:SAM-dependent methyltransferase